MRINTDDLSNANFGQNTGPANSSHIMIGIMGPTGTGKSSLIQRLTGDQSIEIGHSVESATSEIGLYNYFDNNGRCVTFVDSPGFDDSRQGVTDTDVLRKIAAFLEQEFSKDKKLSGIIYLHRITDTRMGGVSVRNLKMFRKLCGDDALKNVVVVTTRWDDVHEKDREAMAKREKELMSTPGKFFEPLIAAGGRFLRHDNTAESAYRIMAAFLNNRPIPLQIQLEMRDGIKLEDTAAGSELAAELKKLMEEHSSEMKNLKEEMAEAIAAKDEALKKELEAERIKMQEEMTKWEEQKKSLADDLAAAREEAKKRQEEADLKLREQGVEFNRRVKETEERAEKERIKLETSIEKMSSERIAADKKLEALETAQKAAASSSRVEQARIQSLVNEARNEKEATEQKHRNLLRSMRAQVCHWKSFSDTLRSASFKPAPIGCGVRDGVSSFIMRYKTRGYLGWCYDLVNIKERHYLSINNGSDIWDSQVLVGNPSPLIWASLHGRFQLGSIRYNPVPGWDKELGEIPGKTKFIARFSHLGNIYVTDVADGDNGVSDKIDGACVKVLDYDVLCYKDL